MKLKREQAEELPLGDAVAALLEECRMVLPGIQALFGFQLIAVFNSGFGEKLSPSEQVIHLIALTLVALSSALIIAPAAYHRQTAPRHASEGFIRFASWLLLLALIPLIIGIALDFYLISRIILQDTALSVVLALLLTAFFAVTWYLLPRLGVLRKITGTEP